MKIRNVSGQELIVPWLGGRLVYPEQAVDVAQADVFAFTQQEGTWAPADDEARAAHAEVLDALAVLLAHVDEAPADVVDELSARELIDVLIPTYSAERLEQLVAAELGRPRPRTTVLAAAEERALALLEGAVSTPADGAHAGDHPDPDGADGAEHDDTPED